MIQLRELHLDGWLSYDTAVINLQAAGINAIIGKMGSGKSAILEAISYLITGKTLRQKESVKYLINRIIDNGYDIALKLNKISDEVLIREVRNRTIDNGLHFYINGIDKRGKTDLETRKNILQYLGTTPTSFKAVSIIGQGHSQALVQGTATERAQVLVDIFNLGVYDKYIKKCKDEIKTIEKNKEEIEITSRAKLEELTNSKYVLNDIKSKLIKINKTKLANKLKKYIKRSKELHTRVVSLTEKKSSYNSKMSKITNYVQSLKKLANLNIEMDGLIEQLDNLDEEKISKSIKNLSKLESTKFVTAEKIQDLEVSLEDSLETSNICPISCEECPVHIPEQYRETTSKKLSEEISTLQIELKSLDSKIHKLNKSKKKLNNNIILKNKIEHKENLINSISEVIPDNIDPNDFDLYKVKVEKVQSNIKIVQEKIERINVTIRGMQQQLGELDSLQDTQLILSERIQASEQLIKEATKNYDKICKTHQIYAESLIIFKKLKVLKIESIIQLLNEESSKILKKISKNKYNLRISSQKMSADNKRALDKVSIIVSDGYKEMPATMWSGGQITEVSLALILGTWKTATRLSGATMTSLWLDEVFGPIDKKAIDRVFESVVEVCAEEQVTSVFVISHRDLDKRIFDNILYTDMSNGISTLTTQPE